MIMQYEMQLIPEAFSLIQDKKKTIEVRICDEKRNQLKIGDQIIFYKLPGSLESIIVEVIEIFKYATFKELYEVFDKKLFGYGEQTTDQLIEMTYNYYSPEKEKEFGVMGIKIKLL